jgi:hypothetical protein
VSGDSEIISYIHINRLNTLKKIISRLLKIDLNQKQQKDLLCSDMED